MWEPHRSSGGSGCQSLLPTGRGVRMGELTMLMTIALILLILWALGVFAFKVTAGVIHLLLIVAIVVGLVQLFRGGRTAP